mgnify:CR=1 FL=1
MFRSKTKLLQLTVTLTACAFLLIPTLMSVLAGVTVNYFKGVSSGLTFKWVLNVWELYADSIFLSLWLIGFILWLVDVVKIFLGKFEDKDGNKLMNYSQWLAQSSYNKNIISKTGARVKDEEELGKQVEELLKKFNDESDKNDLSEQEEEPLKKSNDKSDE